METMTVQIVCVGGGRGGTGIVLDATFYALQGRSYIVKILRYLLGFTNQMMLPFIYLTSKTQQSGDAVQLANCCRNKQGTEKCIKGASIHDFPGHRSFLRDMYLGYEIANFRREEYHNKAPGGGTFWKFCLRHHFWACQRWLDPRYSILALAAAYFKS